MEKWITGNSALPNQDITSYTTNSISVDMMVSYDIKMCELVRGKIVLKLNKSVLNPPTSYSK